MNLLPEMSGVSRNQKSSAQYDFHGLETSFSADIDKTLKNHQKTGVFYAIFRIFAFYSILSKKLGSKVSKLCFVDNVGFLKSLVVSILSCFSGHSDKLYSLCLPIKNLLSNCEKPQLTTVESYEHK